MMMSPMWTLCCYLHCKHCLDPDWTFELTNIDCNWLHQHSHLEDPIDQDDLTHYCHSSDAAAVDCAVDVADDVVVADDVDDVIASEDAVSADDGIGADWT